jgi:peptide/nickel transport system permease protein
LILMVVVIAILAPVLSTHDRFAQSVADRLAAPSFQHFFGTDQFGRDIYTRVLYGARVSLAVGFFAALGAGIIGGALGIASAFFGGVLDITVQRLVDVVQAFPSLIMAMAIVAVLGFGIDKTAIAIMIPWIPSVARITRSQALSIRAADYVLAGRILGASNARLMLRYIAPNVMAPWLVVVTGILGSAIITEASLSFLGLGISEPNPSWGAMLNLTVIRYVEQDPWIAVFPGLVLSVTVFAFNVFGDAIRDAFDPRLRGR